jgi:hypothetical protein
MTWKSENKSRRNCVKKSKRKFKKRKRKTSSARESESGISKRSRGRSGRKRKNKGRYSRPITKRQRKYGWISSWRWSRSSRSRTSWGSKGRSWQKTEELQRPRHTKTGRCTSSIISSTSCNRYTPKELTTDQESPSDAPSTLNRSSKSTNAPEEWNPPLSKTPCSLL